jgi:hypothetical protein
VILESESSAKEDNVPTLLKSKSKTAPAHCLVSSPQGGIIEPSASALVKLRKGQSAVGAAQEFLCALRCFSSQQAKTRDCWEQLRASLRRKEGLFQTPFTSDFAALDSLRSSRAKRSRQALMRASWAETWKDCIALFFGKSAERMGHSAEPKY